jgi:hypothetical protein
MKKLLLFFGLICMINLTFAQEMVTIHQNGHEMQVSAVRSVNDYPASNIQFWVGSGSNSIVAVFQWCQDETMGVAYGYRWNGSATVYDMLTAIDAADSRFTMSFAGTTSILSYTYQDGTYNEYIEEVGWLTYTINGNYCSGLSDALVNNGYFEMLEWGDCDLPTTNIIPATDPNASTDPVDASLPFSSLLYWVGTGSNSAEFIVNFAQPDTAFAWGFHFDGTTTAQAMVDAIAAADPRFWTEGNPSLNGDIHFVLDNGDTLSLSPVDPNMGYNFWWTNLNGVSAGAGAASTLHNGDVFKYGDMNSAIGWDFQYGYYMEEAWTKVPTPVTPPAVPVEPDTLCTTIHPLTYSEDFASYTADQSMRPYFAGAPKPECWTVYGNGTVQHSGNGTSTESDYFGGVGYSTSTNSFGAIAANDAFFAFIGSQIYTGNSQNYINDMLTTGTRRYAVLPAFDAPLSQTVLTFDHRTNIADANAHLVVGYIVNDTADFEVLETYTADNKVLHHDTIHFNQYANMPADARLTLMWDVASTTASTTGPSYRYCGIDNLTVALDVADTTPVLPVDATISANDILYWVGTGSNEAVMAVNWADTALAWGYRWNGTKTVSDMMTDIAAADPRFSFELGTWGLDDILFAVADGDTLRKVAFSYWESKNNGFMDMGMGQTLANGDFEKWAEPAAGIVVDSTYYEGWGWSYSYVYPMTIYPVSAPVIDTIPVVPVEATIAFSDILFWVGTGSNEAVMAVNWADTALAWGYRWNGEATVADMMNHIAAADPRFSFTGTGMVSDINYIDTAAGMTTPLGITPGNWWESTNNGIMDAGLGQTLANGDFEKWADPAAGVVVDSIYWEGYGWFYTSVYPMTITPVTVPDTSTTPIDTVPEHGPFCGGVGTDGCNAIAADDNQFVAWATGVVLTRGPQNISNPNSPLVTFGGDTNAIGPATLNNSMDAVSLGDGGSALVTFERPIRNGEGPDFAVFENDINGGFLELAFVEVSSDGVHFVRFPATSLTQTETQVGTFGLMDPTFINNLAGKFQIGYGTPFDLEELADSANLNIDSIVYVRIIDVIGTIDPQYATYDAFGHIVNDPWPTDFWTSGFDLTGVGVIYQKPVGINNHEMPQVFAYPNPCNGTLYVINENAEKVALYNMNGQLLEMVDNGDTHITLNMQSYPAGLYLLKVGNGVQKILKK